MTYLSGAHTVAAVRAALSELEDPGIRAVNAKHGDDLGVNLGKLRSVAKELKKNDDLAAQLWATGETASRLVALLIMRPRSWDEDTVDAMMRDVRVPKVHTWFVNYIAKKSPAAEALRLRWLADSDPGVAAAGWMLTTDRVIKKPEGLDLSALLDEIEARMPGAGDPLQWAMNETLGHIGIEHSEHRARVLDIGTRLRVLEDYPTSPGCVSPYVPIWVPEMVRRQQLS